MIRQTKEEKETIIRTDEASDIWTVCTYNVPLKHRLERFARAYPELCQLKKSDSNGCVTYHVARNHLSVHLFPPYKDDRKQRAADRMTRLNKESDDIKGAQLK